MPDKKWELICYECKHVFTGEDATVEEYYNSDIECPKCGCVDIDIK